MRPWIAALLLAGCAAAPPRQDPPPPAPPGAPEVRAVRVAVPPMVDGVANDPAWAEAPETEVETQVFGHRKVGLRSVIHQGSFFLLVRWKDGREDGRKYASHPPQPSAPDEAIVYADLVAIEFPIGDDTPGGPGHDRWLWDAAGIDVSGHAIDCIRERSGEDELFDFLAIYGRPGRFGITVDRSRSADDVLARGMWKEGEWTVEFARALSTGNADDRDLGGIAECPLAIYIQDGRFSNLDSCSATPVLRLLLPPPLPEDHQGPFPEPRGGAGTGR